MSLRPSSLPAFLATSLVAGTLTAFGSAPAHAAAPVQMPKTMGGGAGYSVFIQDGEVYGLGRADAGQLTGSTATATSPRLMPLPEDVDAVKVASEWDSTLVLGSDGKAYGTGSNTFGVITGTGSRSTLTELTWAGTPVPITDLSIGVHHAAFVGADGKVYVTGQDTFGQAGTATSSLSLSTLTASDPLPDGAGTPVAVESGNHNTLVIDSEGDLYATGYNGFGQLTGVGDRVTWAKVTGLPEDRDVVSVASGQVHVAIVLDNGDLYSIGNNGSGQFGNGATGASTTPVLSSSPVDFESVSTYSHANATIALGADGVAYGAGNNSAGDLSDAVAGSTSIFTALASLAPSGTAADVAHGLSHTLVRDTDGLVRGVGTGSDSQLGHPPTNSVPKLRLIEGQRVASTVAPVVTGTPSVGSSLSTTGGSWAPAGGEKYYQWLRDGEVIDLETEASYTVQEDDLGTDLSVEVTYTFGGLTDRTVTSAPVAVPLADITNLTPPAIDGNARLGGTLSVVTPGTWSTSAVTPTYAWFRDGEGDPVQVGTGSEYVVQVADVDADLFVRETVTKTGFNPASADSNTVDGEPGIFENTAATIVSDTVRVGTALTVESPGNWSPAPDTTAYEWRIGDTVVGTGTTYTPTVDDLGDQISLYETVTKTGYENGESNVFAATVVQPGVFSNAPAPTVTGNARVGSSLSASEPDSTPSADSASFTWRRDGVAIPGATGPTYAVVAADAGTQITVTRTYGRGGFTSATSAPSVAKAIAAINTKKPTFTGKAKVGKKLTAKAGTWTAPGHTFSYQWYLGTKAIKKATKTTYTIPRSAKGKTISVRVTAKKAGFPSVTVASTSKKVS